MYESIDSAECAEALNARERKIEALETRLSEIEALAERARKIIRENAKDQ